MTQSTQIASAIIIAGALIAAGLYFGLREMRPSAASPAPAPSTPREEPVAQRPVTTPAQAPFLVDALLNMHRPRLREQCFEPSRRKNAEPPESRFTLQFTFNAEGQEIGRGILEERGTSRPDVTECLTRELPQLRIPPAGLPVRVDADFQLP